MKVVFSQDVTNVARAGDVKVVADGYARNYLFPKKLAALATSQELKKLEDRRHSIARQRDEHKAEISAVAETLREVTLNFAKRVRSKDAIYGSVSNIAISQELKRLGHKVEKVMVKLDEPLRKLGSFDVEIELTEGITSKIQVIIEEATEEEKGAEDQHDSQDSDDVSTEE